VSCTCQDPTTADDDGCDGTEVFALRVLGEDMRPEFEPGDIVIIEPGGAAADGRFVLARHGDGWVLRQLVRHEQAWWLRTLNPGPTEGPEQALPDLQAVRGVVIQKAVPGRRRASKFYI
jgi:DNA polymerase V